MFDLVPGGITFGGRTTIFNEDFFNDLCMPKVTVKRIIWGKPIQPKGELEKFIADVDYVFYNKKKKTFGVKLKNKETITIHLQDGDTWDDEKALLMCFAKYKSAPGSHTSLNDFFGLLDGAVNTEK